MTKTVLMDKYPIFSLELKKEEIRQTTISEIIQYFQEKIQTHPIAKFIAIFNHYEHTKNLNGEINSNIIDAQNIIFCFGGAIPNTKILAVRPRSIGIAELEKSFIIEFMEVPNELLHTLVEAWTLDLRK